MKPRVSKVDGRWQCRLATSVYPATSWLDAMYVANVLLGTLDAHRTLEAYQHVRGGGFCIRGDGVVVEVP